MSLREQRRWRRRGHSDASGVKVYYGHDHIPRPDEPASGGIIKCQDLQQIFPNHIIRPNLLYLVSSVLPPHLPAILKAAKRAGAPIVLNQNGVAYPAWHGDGWEETNKRLAMVHSSANYIIYQSNFCLDSALRFLGRADSQQEVLHNPVDTDLFSPSVAEERGDWPVLLIAGSHLYRYRVTLAVDVLKLLRMDFPSAKLIIAGRYRWSMNEKSAAAEIQDYVDKCGMNSSVEIVGAYNQLQAPDLLRRADILLHTTYNDSCPRLVVEAMACGLPIVYSASGGVPELVGDSAGVGVPAPLDWEKQHPPHPEDIYHATRLICGRHMNFSKAARKRAVDMFDIKPWLQRHREIFFKLVG